MNTVVVSLVLVSEMTTVLSEISLQCNTALFSLTALMSSGAVATVFCTVFYSVNRLFEESWISIQKSHSGWGAQLLIFTVIRWHSSMSTWMLIQGTWQLIQSHPVWLQMTEPLIVHSWRCIDLHWLTRQLQSCSPWMLHVWHLQSSL